MTRTFSMAITDERERGLTMAAAVIRRGGLVVLPVEHSYALACDAFNASAVDALIAAKGRARPIAVPVLVPSAATLEGIAHGSAERWKPLVEAFWPGSLSVVLPAAPSLGWDLGTPGAVMVRMPLHPVPLDLLRRTGPLAAMSANRVGAEAPRHLADAVGQLGAGIEVALDAGERPAGPGSTIVDLTPSTPRSPREGGLRLDEIRTIIGDLTGPSDPRP